MRFDIRRSSIENAEEIIRVKANAFKEEVKIYGHGPTESSSIENIKNAIRNNLSYIFLSDNKIIGGMTVVDKGEGHYNLANLYVALEYQNKGIGKMAMKFLEKEFHDANKWSLETPYLSYRNHYFYEKCGFTKVGETEPDTSKNGFILFLYERIC